jgi:toxin ParE1/3/4
MASVILMNSARCDLAEATEWYAERSIRAANRFVAEYERVESLVAENPERWPILEPGLRKLVFRRFPYSMIYTVHDDQVVVVAVKHHARKPGYWR